MANRIFGQRDIFRQNRQAIRAGAPPGPPTRYWRPKVRSDCVGGPRPCPFVACKHHLFLDVTPRGGLRVPYGEDPEALFGMGDTCALDVAERGGITLEAVARLQGITRERVRQIELMAIARMEAAMATVVEGDHDYLPEPKPRRRQLPRPRLSEDAAARAAAAMERGIPGPRSDLSAFLEID